jgi:altronate hydrolase
MTHNVVLVNPEDNVGVVLADIGRGQEVRLTGEHVFKAVQEIPCGHKVALKDIRSGEPILKYGEEIGYAKGDIPLGTWVHTHNLEIGGE